MSDNNILYQIYKRTVQSLIIALICAELWYLFSVTNLDNIIDNVNVTLIHLIAMYRYQNMVNNWHIYKRLAAAMEAEMFDVTTTRRKRLLDAWIKRSNLYLMLLLGLGSCTLATWYIYPLVDEVDYNLVVTVRLPFKYDTPAVYTPTYILVLIAFNYISCFVIANDLIMQTLLMHLLCQFTVCADCFENVLEDCGVKNYLENSRFVNNDVLEDLQQRVFDRLGKLVRHHQFIVNNTLELKRVWQFPMLCQFSASSMLICFAGYQVATTITESTTKFLMSLLYLLCNMFELFIFCRWSDEIKIQSVNIGNALYCCGWENLIGWASVKSRIMIVLMRTSKPLVMSAGGLYDLSLASYSTGTCVSGVCHPMDSCNWCPGGRCHDYTHTSATYIQLFKKGLSTSDDNILYQIYKRTVQSLIIGFISAELWYLFSVTNLDNIIDNVNVTLIHLIAMYRYRDMVNNWHIYKRLAAAMEAEMFDVTSAKRRHLLYAWIRRSNLYLMLLLGLGSCTLATWYVYPLVDDVDYNLAVAVRLPFEYDSPVVYPLTYILVLIAFNYTSFFVMVNDLIMQTLLMHLLCQFTVCADCFANVLEDCGVKNYLENSRFVNKEVSEDLQQKVCDRLGKLVRHHQFIVNNTLELKKVWQFPMLCQFLASSMLICFVGYQVATTITESITKFLMSLLYLLYNMFELFIFCRWSDEIKIQSVSIGNALYCCGWENLIGWPSSVKSRIMIVLMRTSKPLVMSAGGLYDLSLASYSTLIKTSYSALTVLLRARKD